MKAKILLVIAMMVAVTSLFAGGKSGFANLVPQKQDIPKFGKDSVKCVMNLSLYIEPYKYWKQSRYKSDIVKDAIKPWLYVFNNCPRASQNALIHGVKIMEYRIKHAKSEQEKEKLIDTLLMVYDARAKYFPTYKGRSQIGKIMGYKGVDLYKYRPDSYKEANEILRKSIDEQKDRASGSVYIYYFRTLIRMAQNGDVDPSAVVDAYDEISGYLDSNIKKYKAAGKQNKVEIYENIKGSIESMFEPFANCDDLVRIYQKKFNENPEDVELLKKITEILSKRKCIESDLYLNAVENLYKLEPTPESAYLLGKMYLKKENYDKALEYLKQATKMTETEPLFNTYMFLADIYRYKNNYQKAREMALKAAKIDPTKGQPYAFIGDLYAESAQKCGNNDLTKLDAYWAAVDKYKKAKQVEPDLAEQMNKRIAAYSKHFPSKETLFFYGIEEGSPYKVGCWINENTIARAAK